MIIVAYTYVATPIKCNSLIDCFARCRLPACLPACLHTTQFIQSNDDEARQQSKSSASNWKISAKAMAGCEPSSNHSKGSYNNIIVNPATIQSPYFSSFLICE